MTSFTSKLPLLALAVSGVLAGSAQAGHEITGQSKDYAPIEEPGKKFGGSVGAGYWSKYIFRGTNLTPSSDGLIWAEARVYWSPWENGTFTFGAWAGSQQGTAQVPGVERIGESGGGAIQTGAGTRGGNLDFTGTGRLGGTPQGTQADPNATTEFFQEFFGGDDAISGDDLVDFLTAQFGLIGANLTRDDVITIIERDLPTFLERSGGVPQQITRFQTSNTAIQNRFNEMDVYVEYRHDFGPIELAVGNIFFYIDRDSTSVATVREFYASEDARQLVTQLSKTFLISGGLFTPAIPLRADHPEDLLLNSGRKVTVRRNSSGDEMFDRVYAEVSTNLLGEWGLKPRLIYYHTVYSEGDIGDTLLTTDRYDVKGGYAEFKLDGHIPLLKSGSPGTTDYKTGVTTGDGEFTRLAIDPHLRVSYSFRDRADQDGTPLTGWNHVQVGAELVWNVTDTFRIVPEVAYMHHLSDPVPGTERDAWWGGGKFEVIF
jgi:hypothetical protein